MIKTRFKKLKNEPNFQLVIVNSNIEHSTESMVQKLNNLKLKIKKNLLNYLIKNQNL